MIFGPPPFTASFIDSSCLGCCLFFPFSRLLTCQFIPFALATPLFRSHTLPVCRTQRLFGYLLFFLFFLLPQSHALKRCPHFHRSFLFLNLHLVFFPVLFHSTYFTPSLHALVPPPHVNNRIKKKKEAVRSTSSHLPSLSPRMPLIPRRLRLIIPFCTRHVF
ncbi:hypothetical protein BC940DRAFT_84896 [Gongronella butleri]|nr:hypothetical protein BC940DRAFT_84896 [Gongronella butleri]